MSTPEELEKDAEEFLRDTSNPEQSALDELVNRVIVATVWECEDYIGELNKYFEARIEASKRAYLARVAGE